jgi:tRNA G18 (ribose-2'-O)-methylase SpoU
VAIEAPIDETPEQVREILRPLRHDFSVAIYRAGNAFAVGAIVRAAHNFLAREIFLIGDAPHYEKASMGMEKYEEIETVSNDDAFFAKVDGRPIWALEKDDATHSLHASSNPFPPGVVFLFGSERDGLSDDARRRCDRTVAIPIYGVNHSLPLAIAAGIVMHEWTRRHYEHGQIR